jgi:hypothetical protein
MKNILMITACVATLVTAASFASAQGLNEHRDPPAAAASEQKAPAGKTDHKSESMKPAPTAQAPDKPTGGKSETVGQGSGTQPAPHNAQTPSEHTAPNEAARAESKPGAPAALSTEHHARFRDTIRSERTAPLNDVRFR